MGNKHSCCAYSSGRRGGSDRRKDRNNGNSNSGGNPNSGVLKKSKSANGHILKDYGESPYEPTAVINKRDESLGNLQHISEREPDDWEEDPSLHPTTETMFMEKSKQAIQNGMVRKKVKCN